VWVDATLRAYLRNPQAVIKGTTMAIPGYTSDTEFNAVIAVIRKLK
jgi:cytochrome c2